eukprot:TRINITY_DN1729_c0_g1_i2.p1 TRINITY_DN1729_c0_g1~~TRINITY_DN1729_c0_g1_i2.p1  ORF type:complete len:106 (+),score=2.29 TRINITY_DN1729_c0_g1_i2:93-410(+)
MRSRRKCSNEITIPGHVEQGSLELASRSYDYFVVMDLTNAGQMDGWCSLLQARSCHLLACGASPVLTAPAVLFCKTSYQKHAAKSSRVDDTQHEHRCCHRVRGQT